MPPGTIAGVVQFVVGLIVGGSVVALLFIVFAPSRRVRAEKPLDRDVETKLLLGEDPDDPTIPPAPSDDHPQPYSAHGPRGAAPARASSRSAAAKRSALRRARARRAGGRGSLLVRRPSRRLCPSRRVRSAAPSSTSSTSSSPGRTMRRKRHVFDPAEQRQLARVALVGRAPRSRRPARAPRAAARRGTPDCPGSARRGTARRR